MSGAEAAFRLAIESNDDVAAVRAALNLWVLLSRRGYLRDSHASYMQAIDLVGTDKAHPSIADVSVKIGSQFGVGNYGWVYGMGKHSMDLGPGARRAYQRAIDSGHPEEAPIAAVGLGAMLVEMHDWTGARAAYQCAFDSGHHDCVPIAAHWLNWLGGGKESSQVEQPREADIRRPLRLSATPFAEELFAEFGRNLPEDRKIDATMQAGIDLANSGNWDKARKIFVDSQRKHPDYDVPYIWLADFLHRTEGPANALAMLKDAAKKCRRKSNLLGEAAELSLLEGNDVRGGILLFAQCIGSMKSKPDRGQVEAQRACLFMKELFRIFGNAVGVSWADSMQIYTYLEESLIARIREAVDTQLTSGERDVILRELPEISDHLCTMFPPP